MPSETKQREINAAAFEMSAPDLTFEFAESDKPLERDANGELRATVKLFARSPKPIQTRWWPTPIIHNMAGMFTRGGDGTCLVDWCHGARWGDPDDILGAGDKIKADNSGLTLNANLVSVKENDTSENVIRKGRAGVPFEASIDWNGAGSVVTEYAEGTTVSVNGKQYAGPLTVVEKWPLRSVALCPYGQDSRTKAQFSDSGDKPELSNVTVTITKHFAEGSSMSTKPSDASNEPSGTNDEPSGEHTEPGGKSTTVTRGKAEPADPGAKMRAEIKQWGEVFGEPGFKLWTTHDGDLTAALLDDRKAFAEREAALNTKVKELTERLGQVGKAGEETPADDAEHGEAGGKKSKVSLAEASKPKAD